jgi:beta-galactosidase GanA
MANALPTATARTRSSTSPRYREFCRRIAEQMAIRFGHNPNVVGWQIDNEYGYAQMSYDEITRQQFQDWLKAKYGTLDHLNTHWSTSYWSQTYDNWEEIPIPVGGHNPGLMLDWKHFVTYTWTSYQQNQIDVIRETRRVRASSSPATSWAFSTDSITTPSPGRSPSRPGTTMSARATLTRI